MYPHCTRPLALLSFGEGLGVRFNEISNPNILKLYPSIAPVSFGEKLRVRFISTCSDF